MHIRSITQPPRLITRAADTAGEGAGEGDTPPAGPSIEGYAAVFWNDQPTTQYMLYDDLAERIMPGCFDRAIREDDVRALFNHDPNQLLGRTAAGTLRLSVDRTGLAYSIDPPDTDVGQNVTRLLARGDLSGSSFSFIPTETVYREQDDLLIREIHQVRLFDAGPVTYPAYEATTSGLRGMPSGVQANDPGTLGFRVQELEPMPPELLAFRAKRATRRAYARYLARARSVECE